MKEITEDFELTLFDRLEMIRSVLQYVDEDTAYIAFSGGKDSTVLHYLIDEAMPKNRYKRVFSNTGIEFQAIVEFVKELQKNDDRIEIITPGKNIKKMLEEDGYPFKSKFHSRLVDRYQRTGYEYKSVIKYIEETESLYSCPKKLKYQFEEPGLPFKVSAKCCDNLKKKPFKDFEKRTGMTMGISAVRGQEGGIRNIHASSGGGVAYFVTRTAQSTDSIR